MPQPSDNTLGAPTEGLGQNVTFAYSNEQGIPQLEGGDPGRIRAGVIGGPVGVGGTKAQGVQAAPNPTLDVLLKVGESILKPVLEKRKTEAYVSGMQRAMQGEAVTEIANSQPWYSKLFGEGTDVIEGARAYTGNTVAQTTVAAMEDKMPSIRQMDGPTAQKFFVDSINGAKTGDPATDLAVMQSLTRALPQFMRRQAKEHYAWKQERATAAEDASFKSGADNLQKIGATLGQDGSTTTQADVDAATLQFVQNQVPAAGRDEENWKKGQTARYIEAAKNGQFHAVYAGMRPVKEGAPSVFDTLDADQRARITSAVEAGEGKLRNKYSMAWSDQLATVEASSKLPPTGTTTRDLAAQIDAMNTKFQKETGSKAPFILPRERAAYLSGSTVAIQREYAQQAKDDLIRQEKLAAEGNKAAAAQLDDQRYDDAISKGRVGTLVAAPGYSTEKANVRVIDTFRNLKTPEAQDDLLVRMVGTYKDGVQVGDGFVSEPIAKQKQANFNSALSAGAFTDQTKAVIEDAARLRARDMTTFDKYYGDLAPKIDGYLTDVQNGSVAEGAFVRRFIDTKKKRLDDKDMKAGIAAVTSEYNSFGSGVTTVLGFGKKLQPGQARQLASAIGDTASAFSDVDGDVKGGFVRAMKSRPDIEVQGGYVFRNAKNQTRLDHYLNSTVGPGGSRPVASDDIDHAFKGAVDYLLYGEGDTSGVLASKATDVLVYRLPDDKTGVPQFTLAANVDGDIKRAHLSAKDIYKFSDRKAAKKKAVIDDNSREAQAEALYQSVVAPQQ